MMQLEERLRLELPELADALIDAEASVQFDAAAAYQPVALTVDGSGVAAARNRRLFALAAAGVAAVATVAVAVDRIGGQDMPVEIVTAVAPAPVEFGHWEPISTAPMLPRAYAATTWSGSEAVFWAGSNLNRDFAFGDGAAYNPSTDTWRTLAVPGWGHPGLTSASFEGEMYALAKGGGTRLDLTTGTWSDLPSVVGMFLAATVATDDAVWGLGPAGQNPEGQADIAIARYEPASNTWSYGSIYEGTDRQARIVSGLARLETSVVWTGTEIVVWGGTDGGLGFDPTTETWRSLASPESPFGPIRHSTAIAIDGSLGLFVEIEGASGPSGAIATLGESGWTWLETQIPLGGDGPISIAEAGQWLVLFSAGQAPTTLHLPSGAWLQHNEDATPAVEAPNSVWTGDALVTWGGDPANSNSLSGAIWTPPEL